jgi:hypothetical protein
MGVLLVVLLSSPVLANDACDGQGNADLTLVGSSPPAVGGVFTMSLAGRPYAPFTIAADTGMGPSIIPGVGVFCLDLGPNLKVLFDGIRNGFPFLPDSGTFEFGIRVPRRPELAGKTFYMQAAILDSEAPNGIAISEMVMLTVLPALVEDFSTTVRRDGDATTALWEGNGVLVGEVSPPRMTETGFPDSNYNLPHPLIERDNPSTPLGCRFQMKFQTNDIGAVPGESIVGMSWAPRSNFVFASTYNDMTIKLDNFPYPDWGTISSYYALNYDEDGPTTVYEGDYVLGNDSNAPWVPWPEFTQEFEYESSQPLIFEVEIPEGGDTYQLFRNNYTGNRPRARIYSNAGEERSSIWAERTIYRSQFVLVRDRTIGQSVFLDTGLADPDYFEAHIQLGMLPTGTRVEATYEGANDLDGDEVPDPETYTGFVDGIDDLDGYRFIRFRLRLKGLTYTGEVPTVRYIAIPYAESE